MKQHTNVITLPRMLAACLPKPFNSLTVALAIALALDHHDGDGSAIKRTADRLRHRSREHGPKLRRLARELSDREAVAYAIRMTHDVTRALRIQPERPYEFIPQHVLGAAPTCHYRPMHVAGEPHARHWACLHCATTHPLSTDVDHAQPTAPHR